MKKRHKAGFLAFVLMALILFAGRIVATRLLSGPDQVKALQDGMAMRVLYFAALIAVFRVLLCRSGGCRYFTAFLMLIPLVLDAWYLLPQESLQTIPLHGIITVPQLNILLKCLLMLAAVFAKPEFAGKPERS